MAHVRRPFYVPFPKPVLHIPGILHFKPSERTISGVATPQLHLPTAAATFLLRVYRLTAGLSGKLTTPGTVKN